MIFLRPAAPPAIGRAVLEVAKEFVVGDRRRLCSAAAPTDESAERRDRLTCPLPQLYMEQMLDAKRGRTAKYLKGLALPSGIEPLSPP